MARINVYDRSHGSTGALIGWFNDASCTDQISESTYWDGNNHRGTVSHLQIGYERLLRTSRGRWVRHYNARNEFSGPEFYEFLTDDETRDWLLRSNDSESEAALERWFGEPEEETGPSVGGRPVVGPAISVAIPPELLARIDTAAKTAGVKRAEWIRQAAEAQLDTTG